MGMATILITHDLGVVNEIADDVIVMYSGRIIEQGPASTILYEPKHPYTKKLLAAVPKIDGPKMGLAAIEGQVRPATAFVDGCRFAERCTYAEDRCRTEPPPELYNLAAQKVACFIYDPQNPMQKAPKESLGNHALSDTATKTAPLKSVASDLNPILQIESLKTWFPVQAGVFRSVVGHVKAVDDISLSVHQGETLALVGESGCGKSTLGLTILRLIESTAGKVLLNTNNQSLDVLSADKATLMAFRKQAQIIFQDPFASLNPRFSVREIINEGLRIHEPKLSADDRDRKIGDILEEVGLPRDIRFRYPHEFSGGQRQRIAIARALVLRPKILILDEATSALDVSIQAQVLNLLLDLQKRYNMTYIFITHNLGVVRYTADHVAVMYLGKIVEYGPTEKILSAPSHPYTQKLVASVPSITPGATLPEPLHGDVPSSVNPPRGCSFHPRCPLKAAKDLRREDTTSCTARTPGLNKTTQNSIVRCHFQQ
jgi:peptide/nickel transport system ATP-binding protein